VKGRKPEPTVLRVLRGNPGRRPINPAEPKHGALARTCPAAVADPAARAEWRRVVAILSERGHVTTVDRAVLMGYCVKFGQWVTLEREAAGLPFVVRSPKGYPLQNPVLGMAHRAFELMLKAAAELGITPSSRARVVAQAIEARPATPDSKWAGVLK